MGKPEIATPTIADLVPITEIMSRDVVCARPDLSLDLLVQLLVRNHIGCVPIVDEGGHPTGMVTKFDLLEQIDTLFAVATASDDPSARALLPMAARDLMMPIAITIDEHATIAHAAALMTLEHIHHMVVVSASRAVIGVVSTLDIVGWLARNDGYVNRTVNPNPE